MFKGIDLMLHSILLFISDWKYKKIAICNCALNFKYTTWLEFSKESDWEISRCTSMEHHTFSFTLVEFKGFQL